MGDRFISECTAEFRKCSIRAIRAISVVSDQLLVSQKSNVSARRWRRVDLLVGSTPLVSCLSTRLTSLSTSNHLFNFTTKKCNIPSQPGSEIN